MKLFRRKEVDNDYLSPELEAKLDDIGALISANKTEYLLGHISEATYKDHLHNYAMQIDELERSEL